MHAGMSHILSNVSAYKGLMILLYCRYGELEAVKVLVEDGAANIAIQ